MNNIRWENYEPRVICGIAYHHFRSCDRESRLACLCLERASYFHAAGMSRSYWAWVNRAWAHQTRSRKIYDHWLMFPAYALNYCRNAQHNQAGGYYRLGWSVRLWEARKHLESI